MIKPAQADIEWAERAADEIEAAVNECRVVGCKTIVDGELNRAYKHCFTCGRWQLASRDCVDADYGPGTISLLAQNDS